MKHQVSDTKFEPKDVPALAGPDVEGDEEELGGCPFQMTMDWFRRLFSGSTPKRES